MLIVAFCPHPECGQKYKVEPSQVGLATVCRRCGREFVVAAASETAMAAPDTATKAETPRPDDSSQHERVPQRLGRFEIRGRLGAGAFGAVYRAHDPVLDREVALKVPRASALERPELKARFLREPKAAAKLSHPNIVPVFDAGSDGDQFYIASAFIEGRTLKAVLEDDPPKLRRTAQIVRQLAEALDYAHRMGVIHRDVKPANVMLDAQGQPMLMDFGLARLATSSEEKLTQDGTVMGTPAYMAPEQADGSLGEVSPAADQYSLGVVLYEMLCGETPFTGPPAVLIFNAINKVPEPPRSKDAAVPRDLETICLKAISMRAGERYASCGEMAEDLRRWLADEPIHARRIGLAERTAKWARRQPILAAAALGVAFLAVVSTVLTAGLLVSRQRMAQAVQDEEYKTAEAKRATDEADEATWIAKKEEQKADKNAEAARKKEAEAKAISKKLEAAKDERTKAEAAAKKEADQSAKLTEKLKEKDSTLKEKSDEMERRRKQLKEAEDAQKPFLDAAAWGVYTQRLSAADKAYQKKDTAAALSLLNQCPADQRGWEWNYLKMLCDGKTPVESDMPGVPWGGLVVSSNLRFACNRAGATGDTFQIVELPDLKPAAEVRLTGTAARGTWYLSPAGNAILAQATASDWFLMDLSNHKRTELRDKTPVGPLPFSPDGTLVLLVEKHRKTTERRDVPPAETVILTRVAAPKEAVELQGATGDGWKGRQPGEVYVNAVRLLGFAFVAQPIVYGTANLGHGNDRGKWDSTTVLRRWLVPAESDAPIPYNDVALEAGGTRVSGVLSGISQNAGVFVFSPSEDQRFRRPTGSRPQETTVFRAESKQIVASIPLDFVALSPDGGRVLLHDREKGRLTLFDTNAKQELPRLSVLPWENYGAIAVQMNPEWTVAIMAKQGAIPSIHCWSIAHHPGEK